MVYIADMELPKSCQECPFSYMASANPCCLAKASYVSPENGGTFDAPRLLDGNDERRDSACPLYDNAAIDAGFWNASG